MVKKLIVNALFMAFLNLIFVSFIFADIIYLKDGHKEEGEIVEEHDDYIVILNTKNLWRVVIYKRLIDKIERSKTTESKTHEKSEKGNVDKKNQNAGKDNIKECKPSSFFEKLRAIFRKK